MLHENPERLVSDGEKVFLNLVMTSVPMATIGQAAILYPTAFRLPAHMTEEYARKFLPGQTSEVSGPTQNDSG